MCFVMLFAFGPGATQPRARVFEFTPTYFTSCGQGQKSQLVQVIADLLCGLLLIDDAYQYRIFVIVFFLFNHGVSQVLRTTELPSKTA